MTEREKYKWMLDVPTKKFDATYYLVAQFSRTFSVLAGGLVHVSGIFTDADPFNTMDGRHAL